MEAPGMDTILLRTLLEAVAKENTEGNQPQSKVEATQSAARDSGDPRT